MGLNFRRIIMEPEKCKCLFIYVYKTKYCKSQSFEFIVLKNTESFSAK